MIIMALDHVRDYFHSGAMTGNPLDLSTTTPALFFTRWITHFCAPGFVFLSGMAAYRISRYKSTAGMSRYLLTRGTWLIAVEIVIMSLILTFDPSYKIIFLLVLWAIGWSMIFLGLLVRLSYQWIVGVGLLLFFAHSITDHVALPSTGTADMLWKVFLTTSGAGFPLSGSHLVAVSYAILPWTGIMLLGYAAGRLYDDQVTTAMRRKWLLYAGAGLLLLFLLLRLINHYGDPVGWETQRSSWYTLLSFVNVTKYPPSLQFGCLTIGVCLLLLLLLDKRNNRTIEVLTVYGRVPFFYYLTHFLVIHLLCVVVFFLSGYTANEIRDPGSPFLFRPVMFGFGLPVVYGYWLLVVVLLYFPCKWFGKYKQEYKHKKWLSYL